MSSKALFNSPPSRQHKRLRRAIATLIASAVLLIAGLGYYRTELLVWKYGERTRGTFVEFYPRGRLFEYGFAVYTFQDSEGRTHRGGHNVERDFQMPDGSLRGKGKPIDLVVVPYNSDHSRIAGYQDYWWLLASAGLLLLVISLLDITGFVRVSLNESCPSDNSPDATTTSG